MRDTPIFSLKTAASLLRLRGGNNVVELGSIRRNPIEPLDGGSTLIWIEANLSVWSVDTDPNASKITKELCPQARVINDDAHNFLRSFRNPIDLLYLDAWDAHLPRSAENHFEAFKLAEARLTNRALVLIDDTDGQLSKGELVIPYAKKLGFTVLWTGRQTMLAKGI